MAGKVVCMAYHNSVCWYDTSDTLIVSGDGVAVA